MNSGDPRIKQVQRNMISTSSSAVHIVNSYGLGSEQPRRYGCGVYAASLPAMASACPPAWVWRATAISANISPKKMADEAVEEALFNLNAAPVPSGDLSADHC